MVSLRPLRPSFLLRVFMFIVVRVDPAMADPDKAKIVFAGNYPRLGK